MWGAGDAYISCSNNQLHYSLLCCAALLFSSLFLEYHAFPARRRCNAGRVLSVVHVFFQITTTVSADKYPAKLNTLDTDDDGHAAQ